MGIINYCAKCGSKVNDNYKYCSSCGAKIERNNNKQSNPEEIKHVDNYMDDREFRNLVYAILKRTGFTNVELVDERLVDDSKTNDNAILARMNDFTYLISTYLNKEITIEIINECFKEIEQNNATFGMIFTNTVVKDEIKIKAKNMNIDIVDRSRLIPVL